MPTRHAVAGSTGRKQELFLECFAQTGVMAAGARAAGVHRQTVHYWLEHDDEFGLKFHVAEKEAVDYLEMLAVERATAEENPSDRLLEFLLKARDPRFRDKYQVEQNGTLEVRYTNDWRPVAASNSEMIVAERASN